MSSTITILLACILPFVGLVLIVASVFFLRTELGQSKRKVSDWIQPEKETGSNLRELRTENQQNSTE